MDNNQEVFYNDKSIRYINLKDGEGDRPIDAISVGGKTIEDIGTLVTKIDSNSTDKEYPSAKCIYEIIYGKPESDIWYDDDIWYTYTIW